MPLILLGYDSSIATGSVLVDCKSLPDPGMSTVSGSGYIVDARMKKLYAAFTLGANLTRAQAQNPTFNKISQHEIAAINKIAAVAGGKPRFEWLAPNGRALTVDEVLGTQVIQSGAAAENDIVGLLVGDTDPVPVLKEHFTIRFTLSTTLTAHAWTNGAITLNNNLPAGRYDVLGARINTAGGALFRIRFVGSAYAPGGMCAQVDTAHDPDFQRHGLGGVWGTFAANLLPSIDMLSTSADTSESGEFDLAPAA